MLRKFLSFDFSGKPPATKTAVPPPTLGVEEEIAIVDKRYYYSYSKSPFWGIDILHTKDVITHLNRNGSWGSQTSTADGLGVEMRTKPCNTVDELMDEVLLNRIEAYKGLYTLNPKYHLVMAATLPKEIGKNGLHLHAGLSSTERDFLNITAQSAKGFSPLFQALSGTSAFRSCSYELKNSSHLQRQQDNAYPYPNTHSKDCTTLELKAPDETPRLKDVRSLAALYQLIIWKSAQDPSSWERFLSRERDGFYWKNVDLARNNSLQFAELYMADGILVPLQDVLAQTIEKLAPLAKDLELEDELEHCLTIAKMGTCADRQHALVKQHGLQDMDEIAELIIPYLIEESWEGTFEDIPVEKRPQKPQLEKQGFLEVV